MMHNVINPSQFEFLENVESQSDHDDSVFGDYFVVPELNVSINLSFIDPVQYKISDLNAQMLTKNLKYVEHNEFLVPHQEATTNEQPIII
jgi:hypothetical protein